MPGAPAIPPEARPDLDAELAGTRFGPVWWFAGLDSTNSQLLRAARQGAGPGSVVVADHQSAGRGRLGRRWEAPAGASLLVSVLLPAASDGPALPAAAVAMAEAIEATTRIRPSLKWPNDLLASGGKLAGILAERSGDALVVGIGVNVAWPAVPPELDGIATACNLEGGRPVERRALLVEFLRRYDARLADEAGTRRAYRERLATLGATVRVELPSTVLEGRAVDVDAEGHLVVAPADGSPAVAIAAGDVVHLRPA